MTTAKEFKVVSDFKVIQNDTAVKLDGRIWEKNLPPLGRASDTPAVIMLMSKGLTDKDTKVNIKLRGSIDSVSFDVDVGAIEPTLNANKHDWVSSHVIVGENSKIWESDKPLTFVLVSDGSYVEPYQDFKFKAIVFMFKQKVIQGTQS